METEVKRQALYDEAVRAYDKVSKKTDDDEFAFYSLDRMIYLYKEMMRWMIEKDLPRADHYVMHLDALVVVVQNRVKENQDMMTSQDYRWSLLYVAKDKKYRLTETKLDGTEWVINQTSWDSMGAALSYIDRTNKERQPIKTH